MTTTPPAQWEQAAERFRRWYVATYDDVLRFVERRVHPALAEDVVADAYLVAWRRLGELPTEHGESRAWLFGIARGCLANARRREQRKDALAVRIAQATDASAESNADPDLMALRADLAAGWRRLRPADQEVIALTVWDGLTGSQAAQVLGISATAYRLRLSRARRALRRLSMASAPSPLTTSASHEGAR